MAQRITLQRVLERLQRQVPMASAALAARALHATLRALADELTESERAELARELPSELGPMLRSQAPSTEAPSTEAPSTQVQPTLSGMVARVSAAAGVPLGRAIEETELVCRALSELLPAETVQRLRKHLPHLAELFALPEPSVAPSLPLHALPSAPHDLAEGRPGGTHPLASSDLRSLAHRHSVARSDDPHADSKLSSSRGSSQEREGRTLASGRPGSRRPLSEGH